MLSSIEQRIQAAIFALFLCLPAAERILELDSTPPPPGAPAGREAPALPTDLETLDTFAGRFDTYAAEDFGWRNWLIEHFHRLNYRLFRVSENKEVHVGRNGWLYYGGTATAFQRAAVPYTDRERRRWFRSFQKRQEWLAGRDIHYLLTVAPNKHSIYPENLPMKLRRSGQESRWELLSRLLEEHTPVSIVDLHTPLREAKKHELVYERSGSHWNHRGAYIAYRAVFDQLAEWFPELEPVAWEDLQFSPYPVPADLGRLISVSDLLPEERFKVVGGVRHTNLRFRRNAGFVIEQDDPSLPRAVIFHDSFSVALAPLLAEHFSYAVFQWRARFDGELIDRVRPDVVIEQRVERRLTLREMPNILPKSRLSNDEEATQ